MEKIFNVTATLQIFQLIEAETEEEAIMQMKDAMSSADGSGLFLFGECTSVADALINIKCEEREKEGGRKE